MFNILCIFLHPLGLRKSVENRQALHSTDNLMMCYKSPAGTTITPLFFFNMISIELEKMFLFFRHFDENLTGRLSHKDFRSCLRGLNYYLPIVEEGESEPKFEKFLDAVDPGR